VAELLDQDLLFLGQRLQFFTECNVQVVFRLHHRLQSRRLRLSLFGFEPGLCRFLFPANLQRTLPSRGYDFLLFRLPLGQVTLGSHLG
jgi:hypothetical protein